MSVVDISARPTIVGHLVDQDGKQVATFEAQDLRKGSSGHVRITVSGRPSPAVEREIRSRFLSGNPNAEIRGTVCTLTDTRSSTFEHILRNCLSRLSAAWGYSHDAIRITDHTDIH